MEQTLNVHVVGAKNQLVEVFFDKSNSINVFSIPGILAAVLHNL